MQSITQPEPALQWRTRTRWHTPQFNEFAARPVVLFVVFAAFIVITGGIALWAPVGAKVFAVLLLAGPHNWIELRYFLSRFPARWPGNTRIFFLISLAGLAFLGTIYIGLMFGLMLHFLDWSTAKNVYSGWAFVTCVWAAGLVHFSRVASRRAFSSADSSHATRMNFEEKGGAPAGSREPQEECVSIGLNLEPTVRTGHLRSVVVVALLLALSVVAFVYPLWFGIFLVYAHPLLALAILDRELKRNPSKRHWRKPFRFALLLIPSVIGMFWIKLHGIQFPSSGSNIADHLIEQTGSAVLPGRLSAFMLSTLVFLDVMHYAVWMLAIPNWSAGWCRWQPRSIPVMARFTRHSVLLKGVVSLAAFFAIGLWVCFGMNYVATSQIYFVVAIIHVLAEVPFLAWACR